MAIAVEEYGKIRYLKEIEGLSQRAVAGTAWDIAKHSQKILGWQCRSVDAERRQREKERRYHRGGQSIC